MNPRSTDCIADALTTTPSRRLGRAVLMFATSSHIFVVFIVLYQFKKIIKGETYVFEFVFLQNSSELTLQGIARCLMEQLPEYEKEEQETINNEIKTWKADRDILEEIEEEIKGEIKKAREIHFRESEIEKKAHQMAVETLGFWDLAQVHEFYMCPGVRMNQLYYLLGYLGIREQDWIDSVPNTTHLFVTPIAAGAKYFYF